MRTLTESIARRAAKDITKGYDIKVRIEMAIEQALAQRTWVGMTDDEIDSCFEDHGWSPSEDYYPVIKAIEAKLKELNT